MVESLSRIGAIAGMVLGIMVLVAVSRKPVPWAPDVAPKFIATMLVASWLMLGAIWLQLLRRRHEP